MTPRTSSPGQDPAASRAIDAIIEASGDWRSTTLARLRAVILSVGASIVEEVKWKKPSRPMGVPVWSRDGNICIGEALKSAVRLTFPKGALLKDPKHVFNTRLDSATVRAVDFREGDTVNEAALRALIRQAMELNTSKARTRSDAQAPVRAAVGRTHRSLPEPHPQPPPQRHGGEPHPEIAGCSREDDLSDPHEEPPGRCLDGPPASPQYDPIVPDLPVGTRGACVTCWTDASRRCAS